MAPKNTNAFMNFLQEKRREIPTWRNKSLSVSSVSTSVPDFLRFGHRSGSLDPFLKMTDPDVLLSVVLQKGLVLYTKENIF
jgi:hypothetical protein